MSNAALRAAGGEGASWESWERVPRVSVAAVTLAVTWSNGGGGRRLHVVGAASCGVRRRLGLWLRRVVLLRLEIVKVFHRGVDAWLAGRVAV